MNAALPLCLTVLLTLTGPGFPSDSLTPVETALVAGVAEERMQADVRALVELGPRMGGTRSGARAVAWRLDRFEALGLSSEVFDGPEKWCHEPESWSLVAHVGTTTRRLESTWPWGFSPSIDARLPLALEPTEGAALLVSQLRFGRFDPAPLALLMDGVTTPGGEYPKVSDLRRRGGGGAYAFPVFALSEKEGAALRADLEQGPVELEVKLESTIVQAAPRTVVGSLAAAEGSAPGFLLVCAHGDSDAGGPGANDNGSGEAIVMEIARVLSEAVADGSLSPLSIEVRFALWGSEIHSTRDYLARVEEADEPILGVINFDQSGFGSAHDRFYVEPDDLPANRDLVGVLAGILGANQEREGFPREWATNKSVGGTDSYVFSSSLLFEREGLPALTLYTSAWDQEAELPRTPETPGESWSDADSESITVDYDRHYHSAGDTPENTTDREPWNMGWCARVGAVAVLRWARRPR